MAIDRFSGVHTSDSPAAVLAFEEAVEAIAAHRPNAADALQRCHAADPDMTAAHALKGLAAVMLARPECLAAAVQARSAGQAAVARRGCATRFESVLLDVLDHLLRDDSRKAVAILDLELHRSPTTFLFAKLAHGLRFMAGDQTGMLASTSQLLPSWSSGLPGFGYLLGCHAFALEENGHYLAAERAGHQAVEREPGDAWGMHAVAHVYEMQGRTEAGVRWLRESERSWRHCHNFRFHMAWHLALFLLEEGRFDEVLDLYDHSVRPVATDDFRDVANATSLLWRLRQEGADVGARWEELAEIAARRRREALLVFATLHHLLALAAVGDRNATSDLLAGLTDAAAGDGEQSAVARRVGLPLARIIAGGSMDPSLLVTVAERLPELGGSHAQRDVFLRTLIERASATGDLKLLDDLLDLRHQLRRTDRFATIVRTNERQPALAS